MPGFEIEYLITTNASTEVCPGEKPLMICAAPRDVLRQLVEMSASYTPPAEGTWWGGAGNGCHAACDECGKKLGGSLKSVDGEISEEMCLVFGAPQPKRSLRPWT